MDLEHLNIGKWWLTTDQKWFWGFGLLCRHTANPLTTSGSHKSCVTGKPGRALPEGTPNNVCFGFWFLVCYTVTQLALQLQQEPIQVVRSNRVARKRLTESSSTPAMDLGHKNVVLKWCICMLVAVVDLGIVIIIIIINCIIIIIYFFLLLFFPPFSLFFSFFGVHQKCIWVEMDVLWGRCSILCKMYERGEEVVREWFWQQGAIKSAEVEFSNSQLLTQRLGWCGHKSEWEEESADLESMYSPKFPPFSLTWTGNVWPHPPCHPSACWSVFHAFEVRACTAPTISTIVRVETRLLSVVLEGLCMHLCALDAGVVCGCEVGCEILSDGW